MWLAMAGSSAAVVDAAGGRVGLSNDDNGVADAIERYVLAPRGLAPATGADISRHEVARCRLTVSNPVLKAPMVSVLETRVSSITFTINSPNTPPNTIHKSLLVLMGA